MGRFLEKIGTLLQTSGVGLDVPGNARPRMDGGGEVGKVQVNRTVTSV